MRVRYQMVGESVGVRCDMEDWRARKFYKELFSNGRCEWAELVGEDDENYMDILESFDHIDLARAMAEIMAVISGIGI